MDAYFALALAHTRAAELQAEVRRNRLVRRLAARCTNCSVDGRIAPTRPAATCAA